LKRKKAHLLLLGVMKRTLNAIRTGSIRFNVQVTPDARALWGVPPTAWRERERREHTRERASES
jgi:hypothetical protein